MLCYLGKEVHGTSYSAAGRSGLSPFELVEQWRSVFSTRIAGQRSGNGMSARGTFF